MMNIQRTGSAERNSLWRWICFHTGIRIAWQPVCARAPDALALFFGDSQAASTGSFMVPEVVVNHCFRRSTFIS